MGLGTLLGLRENILVTRVGRVEGWISNYQRVSLRGDIYPQYVTGKGLSCGSLWYGIGVSEIDREEQKVSIFQFPDFIELLLSGME